MSKLDDQTAFYSKQLQSLVGGVVFGTVRTEADEFGDVFFGLRIKKGDKFYNLIILQDDEGNGPGSFEIIMDEKR